MRCFMRGGGDLLSGGQLTGGGTVLQTSWARSALHLIDEVWSLRSGCGGGTGGFAQRKGRILTWGQLRPWPEDCHILTLAYHFHETNLFYTSHRLKYLTSVLK